MTYGEPPGPEPCSRFLIFSPQRIKSLGRTYKIKAFADDLILTTETPQESIARALEIIEEYGSLAGFKLNKTKTKMLVKNMPEKDIERLEKTTGIKVCQKAKYLGVWITPKNIDLFQNNYIPIWNNIKYNMEKWSKLKLSLLGRVATVKMLVLPKLLFLFQTIPILGGEDKLKEWQRDIARYIWQGQRPRIKHLNMIDIKTRGGLALPDIILYYDAACLTWIAEWCRLEDLELLDLEGFNLRFGWHAYLNYDKHKIHKDFSNHIIRGSIMKVWLKYKHLLEQHMPWWNSPLEAQERRGHARTTKWPMYLDLLERRDKKLELKSYENLKNTVKDWFTYYQLFERYKVDSKIGFEKEPSKFYLEVLNSKTKTLSKAYRILLDWMVMEEQIKTSMTRWAQDVGQNIMLARWENLWKVNWSFTACNSIRENMIKMFYRWHITPYKLSKMYRNASKKCWRCDEVGNWYHLWWECKQIESFWREIHLEIELICNIKFKRTPEAYLIGITTPDIPMRVRSFFLYATTAAKTLIGTKWKSATVPNIKDWMNKTLEYVELAHLTEKIKDNPKEKFIKEWNDFIQYLKKRCNTNTVAIME